MQQETDLENIRALHSALVTKRATLDHELVVSFWLLFKGLKPVVPIGARAGAA
jgi:hypothetical protein